MKTRNAAIAAVLLLASVPGTADAGVVIDVFQSRGDVVATASGSLDLAGLTYVGSGGLGIVVNPLLAEIIIGPPGGGPIDSYTGISGPTSFGSHAFVHSSSATGDIFGVEGGVGEIVVPAGYISGSSLAGSMTLDNRTIAGLGMIPGTYTWTWGSGAVADSLTVNIASVPEPSTLVLAGAALLAGFGMWVRGRNRRAA
jgi:PEP-CTERM motif